jgi:uncharacterized protein YbaP (TraB family)
MIRGLVFLSAVLWAAGTFAADAPFLWKVQGAKATHYLMGSVHLLPKSAYPLPAEVERAYAETSALVLETDLDAVGAPAAQKQILSAARGAQKLRDEIGPEMYARLQTQLETLDLNPRLCDDFKPWFCSLTMSVLAFQKLGMNPDRGVDVHFFNRAEKDGRPMRWLEQPEQQMALFAGMDAQMSRSFLQSALEELEDPGRSPQALIDAWMQNDVAGIGTMVAEMRADHPALYARLLADRNREWLPQLEEIFGSDKPQMVLVGAAHLVGPDGLVTQLTQRGWRLQRQGTAASELRDLPEPALEP